MPDYFQNTDDYKIVGYTHLLVKKKGTRLFVTLNRPEKRNAFTPLLINELAYVMQGVNHDENINSVIIKANGPVFCAGMDLKIFHGDSQELIPEKFQANGLTMAMALRQLNKPLLGVVEGPVIAGGFLIINECTMVIATENVWFRLPEIEIGLFPFQVMERLSEIVGERTALEWALTGRKISAAEALKAGLVNRIFKEGDVQMPMDGLLGLIDKANVNLLFSAIGTLKKMKSTKEEDKSKLLKSVLEQFSNKK